MDDRLSTRLRALVLVVDDDIRSAKLLARMLESDGYDTEVASDGVTAIARLTADPVPDVLITELHLPRADGLAVARYARSRSSGMLIVFVTAHPHALEGPSASVEQPVLLLTKPVDYAELVTRVRAMSAHR